MAALGHYPREPAVVCDGEGCKSRYPVRAHPRHGPPAWFVAGKAPPRWRVVAVDGLRRHLCPARVAAERAKPR